MTSKIIFILVITITATVFSADTGRPAFIDCQSSEECRPGFCCSLQPNRYSIPTCTPLIQDGAVCKPGISILNTTLSYPDGSQVKIWNVHYIMCPCAPGLTCSRADNGKCRRINNEV